jgi:Zn-dependent M28 family amino/carboxypeptidase
VVAFLEGKSDSSEIILLGGHYDTSGSRENGYDDNWNTTFKARGADDNATGVASIMEIARVLSEAGTSFNNKHTFKFIAFGAEESHPVHSTASHVGSLFDAGKMYNADEPLTAAIVLDMIGYNNNYNYTEVISNQASLWLANQIFGYRYIYVPDLNTNPNPPDVPYSDHKSYQDYGFSAILLMENDRPWNDDPPYYLSNPYYHTSSDMPSTLNFTQVEMVAKLALAGAASMGLRDDPTAIDRSTYNSNNLPDNFRLSAYPNPFNGRVNIQFTISKRDMISIGIYNVLGQQVQSLIPNEEFLAGPHNIGWDAGSNPSGVYYCVLKNNYGVKSLKLMLIK